MQCISTPLSEEQLLAAMSDVAEVNVSEHLDKCEFCQECLTKLERAEEKMRRKLHRWDCPNKDELGEFALSILSETEQALITEHVEGCPTCQRDLAVLRQFWEEMDRAEAHERDMIQQNRPRQPKGSTSNHRGILGNLVGVMRGAAAMRGDEMGGLQSFEWENLRLRVSATPEQGHYELRGQLSGPDAPRWRNGLVKVQQGDDRPVLSIVDDRNKFQCRLPRPGEAAMTITAQDGKTIGLEKVRIDPG
jgi:hypothetical protein